MGNLKPTGLSGLMSSSAVASESLPVAADSLFGATPEIEMLQTGAGIPEGGEALSGLQSTGAADAGGGLSGLGYALTGAGGAFGLYQGIDEGSALKMGGNAASLAMLQNPATALWAWIPQIVNFF